MTIGEAVAWSSQLLLPKSREASFDEKVALQKMLLLLRLGRIRTILGGHSMTPTFMSCAHLPIHKGLAGIPAEPAESQVARGLIDGMVRSSVAPVTLAVDGVLDGFVLGVERGTNYWYVIEAEG